MQFITGCSLPPDATAKSTGHTTQLKSCSLPHSAVLFLPPSPPYTSRTPDTAPVAAAHPPRHSPTPGAPSPARHNPPPGAPSHCGSAWGRGSARIAAQPRPHALLFLKLGPKALRQAPSASSSAALKCPTSENHSSAFLRSTSLEQRERRLPSAASKVAMKRANSNRLSS